MVTVLTEVEQAIELLSTRFNGYSLDFRPTAHDWPYPYRIRLVVPSWEIDAYRFTAWGDTFLSVLTEAIQMLNIADAIKAQERIHI